MLELQADREGGVSDHAWRTLLQVAGAGGSTDEIHQCCRCGVVHHVYRYSSLERQLSTARAFLLGESVPVDDECKGLLRMLPVATEVESTVEPAL